MTSDLRLFFYNYLNVLAGSISKIIIGAASLILAARVLGPGKYGILVLFGTVVSIITLFLNWNNNAVLRFGKEEFIKSKSLKKTFWSNIVISSTCFLMVLPLLFIFGNQFMDYIGLPRGELFLVVVFLFVFVFFNLLPTFFQASERMKHFAYIPLISSIIYLIGLILISGGLLDKKVEVVIIFLTTGNVCAIGLALYLLRRDVLPFSLALGWAKRNFHYAFPMVFGGIGQYVVQYIDVMVIRVFLPVASIGIYSVAYRLQEYIHMVPMISVTLMFPFMVSLVVESKRESIEKYFKNISVTMRGK
jgi:O-antigen/teichoic acid export membrane protein